jgi:hypothetical protein
MIPARTFRLTKSQLRADAVRRIAMSRAQHDDEVAANWGSRAAAEGIAEYMAQVKAG